MGGFLAWLAEGWVLYVLHDASMIMSRYKRGRGREIVAETIAGWTPSFRLACSRSPGRSADPTAVGLRSSSAIAQIGVC